MSSDLPFSATGPLRTRIMFVSGIAAHHGMLLCHARECVLVRCSSFSSLLASPRVSLRCRLGWLGLRRREGRARGPPHEEAAVEAGEHGVALAEGQGEEVGHVRPLARPSFP